MLWDGVCRALVFQGSICTATDVAVRLGKLSMGNKELTSGDSSSPAFTGSTAELVPRSLPLLIIMKSLACRERPVCIVVLVLLLTSSLVGYAGLAMSDAQQAWDTMQTKLTQCIDQVKTSAGSLTDFFSSKPFIRVSILD